MSLAKVLAKKVAFKNQPCQSEDCEECGCGGSAPMPVRIPAKKVVLRVTKLSNGGINNLGENMSEKMLISSFLRNINEKNYAQAHKYLKTIVENKLMNRIKNNKGVKVF
jgi:hypothetical protein